MSYIKDLKAKKRRASTQHITADEAIRKINTIVDDANNHVARIEAERASWQETAAILMTENDRLRSALEAIVKTKQLGDAKGIAKEALR